MSSRYIERVILAEDTRALSWLIRAALWPFSILYCIGLAIFLAPYQLGIRKKHRLNVPVISVGNLTFGGTGKTPAVQTICRMLRANGLKVVVLSRGHGGSIMGAAVVSDGEKVFLSADKAGDEPVLLAQSLPGVPIVVGKDRRVSGSLACVSFKPDIIVLDDGLQYWQLHRDLDIVIMNAARPFGSGYVMPAGDLREPARGLKRAGVVLLNTGGVKESAAAEEKIKKLAPKADMFKCRHTPESFVCISDGQSLDLNWIQGRKVIAFCGIGKPQSFFGMLESLGAADVKKMVFADHHGYSQEDISRIKNEIKLSGAEVVVTTLKDVARLDEKIGIDNLFALEIKLDVEDSSNFADRINITNKKAST